MKRSSKDKGSIELIVLGLLCALIVVLAIPILTSLGTSTENALTDLNGSMNAT